MRAGWPSDPWRPSPPICPIAAVKRGTKAIDLKKIADAGCNIAKDQGFNVSAWAGWLPGADRRLAGWKGCVEKLVCACTWAASCCGHLVRASPHLLPNVPHGLPSLQVEHVLVYANDDAQNKADTKMTAGRDVFWQVRATPPCIGSM